MKQLMSQYSPNVRRRISVVCSVVITILCTWPAMAQTWSTRPSEDFRWHRPVPAGPFSVVNTATGSLLTSIPLFKLDGPAGTVFDFRISHTSADDITNTNGQVAKRWRQSYDEWVVPNGGDSHQIQRNSPGTALAWWLTPVVPGPYVAQAGVRDTLVALGGNLGYKVSHKDQTTSTYGFSRGGYWMLTRYQDTHNNAITVAYNAVTFRPTQITDAGGRIVTFSWNVNNGFILDSITLNAGGTLRTWNFNSDANSNLTRVIFPPLVSGGARPEIDISYTADTKNISDLSDLNGNHWHYDYAFSNVVNALAIWKVTDPVSSLPVTFTYFSGIDGTNTITAKIVDQASREARHVYSTSGNVYVNRPIVKVQDPIVTGDPAAFFETYNWSFADGTLSNKTDRRGFLWSYVWDTGNMGNLLSETNPLNQTTQYQYSAQNRLVRIIDPAGHRLINTYDPTTFDLTKKVTDPKTDPYDGTYSNPNGLDITISYSYFANGDLSTERHLPDPASSYSNYDGFGNARTVTDPLGYQFTATFDPLNNKLTSTEPIPGGTTTFSFDFWNRNTKITHPDNTFASFGYDSMSNRTSVTDENNHVTYFDQDALNRTWRIRQAVNGSTTLTIVFAFNSVGDKYQATNPRNFTTNYFFDQRHKLIQVTYPDNTSRKYHYDGNGNGDKRLDGNNNLTLYSFDGANRLLTTRYPGGATVYNHYLADGLRDRMIDPTGSYSWIYNGAHLPTSTYQSLPNKLVTNTYDSKGRKATMVCYTAKWIYTYDAADRIKTISENYGFSPSVTFNYNGNGSLASRFMGNNTRTYYTYDSRGRKTNLSHRFFNGSTETEQQVVSNTYDNVGNPVTYHDNAISTGQSWSTSYSYDWANRLLSEVQTGTAGATFNNVYAYDGNGNRTSVIRKGVVSNYNVDGNDKFASGEGYTFTNYDLNGNPAYVWTGGHLNRSHLFDFENRVTRITYNGGATNTFLYNGDNLRVGKTDSRGTVYYIYDGDTVIAESNTAGAMVAFYTPGVDFLRNDGIQFVRENGLGSTLQVTSKTAIIGNRLEYDGFGVTYAMLQNQFTPYKFGGNRGYYSDGDSGMILIGRRYYLPILGRFLSQNPMGHVAGLNLYRYAGNNPFIMLESNGIENTAGK